MRFRIASSSAFSICIDDHTFYIDLSMLGCCLHFSLFSAETFLEKSDSFLVESVLLLCDLFYTSFLILCHKWPPFVFAGYCIFHYALKISLSFALVPFLHWNKPRHFHFPCVKLLLLILGQVSRQGQTRKHGLLLLHIK